MEQVSFGDLLVRVHDCVGSARDTWQVGEAGQVGEDGEGGEMTATASTPPTLAFNDANAAGLLDTMFPDLNGENRCLQRRDQWNFG